MSEGAAVVSIRTRTVRTPAGEPISVIADEDYAEMAGVSLYSIQKVFRQKLRVLYPLWAQGAVTEKSGRATLILHERATALGYKGKPTALPGLLLDPQNALAVERQTKGKRTYSIRLVALPERWLDLLREMDGELADQQEAVQAEERVGLAVVPEPAYEAVPVDPATHEALEPTTEPVEAGPAVGLGEPELERVEPLEQSTTYLEVAPTVAMALLTQVVEIISAGDPHLTDRRVKQLERDYAEQGANLARRLAENDSLRRQVREAGDQIIALKHERDGIFKRLRIAEHNLEQASNVDTERIVRMRVEQEISKLMQMKPGTSKGADDA